MRTSGRGQGISGPSGTRQGRDQRNDLQHSRGVGQPDLWLVQRLPDGQIRAPEKTVLFSARTVHHGPVVQPLEVRGPPVASRTAKFLVLVDLWVCHRCICFVTEFNVEDEILKNKNKSFKRIFFVDTAKLGLSVYALIFSWNI